MPQPIPYLHFPGTCRDAVHFYEKALAAKVTKLLTIGESPIAAHCTPDSFGDILHAHLELPGGGELMAGDSPRDMRDGTMQGVSLALNYASVAEAERVFRALGEGGEVTMPMQPSFWAKMFGMVTDRFGAAWIVNGEPLPV
jgi:PhnB protein